MKKAIVAVGSTRRPKLNAVTEALRLFASVLGASGGQEQPEFEVVGVEVESGVGHTPLSPQESMRGARQRAESLLQLARQRREPWRYFIGLEGGLDVVHQESGESGDGSDSAKTGAPGSRRIFLESWAYVSDGERGHFGRSGGIEVPAVLAHEVLDVGVELSVAIDRFAGAIGIRDAQGAWGVLSSNLITRQEAFRVAVVAAFAPFYNARMYQAAAARSGSL
jgi:inosine/xanthosine triphosphatase